MQSQMDLDRIETPIDEYEADDGEEIIVDRATKLANQYIVDLWHSTDDEQILRMFEYIHGQTDTVSLDVWQTVLWYAGGDLAVIGEDVGDGYRSIRIINPTRPVSLGHEQQQVLQDMGEPVLVTMRDLSREDRDMIRADGGADGL